MAIITFQIQNPQYNSLVQDILKYVSIIVVFHFLMIGYHGNMNALLKCDKFAENIMLFILSITTYHLIVCELVKIV